MTRPGRRSRRRRAEPQRTCIGCGRVAGWSELVRLALDGEARLTVDHRAPGRGAWLCAGSPSCFERAVRRRAIGRALRAEVRSEDIEAVRARLCG